MQWIRIQHSIRWKMKFWQGCDGLLISIVGTLCAPHKIVCNSESSSCFLPLKSNTPLIQSSSFNCSLLRLANGFRKLGCFPYLPLSTRLYKSSKLRHEKLNTCAKSSTYHFYSHSYHICNFLQPVCLVQNTEQDGHQLKKPLNVINGNVVAGVNRLF